MSEIVNPIESAAREEYCPGVSPGAAARQLCRTLGAMGYAPTLKRMLEDMLGDFNEASFDRSCILRDFDQAAPAAAQSARMDSFQRVNKQAA